MAQDPRQSAQPVQPDRTKPPRRVSRRGKTRPVTDQPRRPQGNRLRLVGAAAPDAKPPTQNPAPIDSATDPRWVLAVSTAQMMEGDVLPPHKRQTLMSQGKSMGLSPFDCSLILATIQDRARRGIALDQCPAASESQLALIPRPAIRPFKSALGENPKRTMLIASGLLALQVLLIWVWLG
ncbi:MAG: hypothetical protein KTR15_14485 [Phycisphaeraceae bacterium]|nr:hypothetical protein [Phycisphaeraceae bacterium]